MPQVFDYAAHQKRQLRRQRGAIRSTVSMLRSCFGYPIPDIEVECPRCKGFRSRGFIRVEAGVKGWTWRAACSDCNLTILANGSVDIWWHWPGWPFVIVEDSDIGKRLIWAGDRPPELTGAILEQFPGLKLLGLPVFGISEEWVLWQELKPHYKALLWGWRRAGK